MKCIFKMFKRICISNLFWNTILVSLGDASVDITVPSAGNCDDDTILICNSTVELEFTGWFGLGRSLLIGGAVVRPEDSNKYSQTVSGKTFSLIINNTDITDEGRYRCNVGFLESTRTLLRVECRAKYVNLSVTRDRTIVIALDKIYPQPEIKLEILDLKNGTEITVSGTFTKKCSTSNSWLDCVWTSSSIFLDGNYSYNAAITTITTSTYTGYFRIRTPDSIDVSQNATIYRIAENRLMNDVTCSADCAPVCQYAWRSDRGINISDSNVLSLGEVDRTADGMYTCIARNWFGQVEMSIILAIMYGPENIVFTPSDTEYTKTEGEAMENIRCSVTCNHNCSVNWHKADTLVSNTGNLALKTIQRDDIGMYQCVATNNDIPGNPSVQMSIDINVRYGPDTVVLSSGSYISLVTGTLAQNITCSADCNPPCSFTWRNMTNNSVQSHGHIFYFGIAELAFQGEYRCTVTNNATGKSIYTTLTVTVESAELAEKGTSIGAIVGGTVGAVVLVCLIVTATVLFYRKRKQNVSENTKEHKNDVYDQLDVTATVSENTTGQNNDETKGGSPDTAYEELRDRNDRKNDVYNQLEVAATVSENTKEQKNKEIKGGSPDTAYEELRDRNDRKNDEYDQLDVAVAGSPNSIDFSPNATIYRIEENRLMNDVTCSADCAPVCQYAWRSDHDKNISNSNVLSLGEVDRTADGMYTCIARNWFGQVEMSIILAVMYGPENIVFNPSDTEYTKTKGEAMKNIRCSVTCNPNCSINWLKADTLVSNTGNLALKTLQRDDMGIYQCVATNNNIPVNPSVQRSIEINIRYGPDTVVLSSGSYISLVTGTLAPNITCSADCNPPCSFTWRNMTNNSVQSHGHIFYFGIVELAFQGEYRCTVRNNATGKSIYTTMTLTVESAELAEKETSIGAIVGGAAGAVVVCLIVTATVLFYRKRKQNVSENTKEHKNEETAYEELGDRNDRKNDVYNQLDVAVTDISVHYEQ